MTNDQEDRLARLSQGILVAVLIVLGAIVASFVATVAQRASDVKALKDTTAAQGRTLGRIEAHLEFIDRQNQRSIEDRSKIHQDLNAVKGEPQ